MIRVISAVFFLAICLGSSTASARSIDMVPTPDIMRSAPVGIALSPSELLSSSDIHATSTIDRVKRRAFAHGLTTVASSGVEQKTIILAYQAEAQLLSEQRLQQLDVNAAITMLMVAAACLMWLTLQEQRRV